MSASNPRESTRQTLAMFIGPEIVALLLVLVLVPIVALLVTLSQHGTRPAVAQPSQPIVAQSPSPSPTGAAALNLAPARAVLASIDRLLDLRASLAKQTTPRVGDPAVITNLLGQVNQVIVSADEQGLAALSTDPRTATLGRKIQTIEQAAAATAHTTQGASLTNTQAYIKGAANVVLALEPLGPVRQELVNLIGTPTSSGSPSPAPPSGSPAPGSSKSPAVSIAP
jgi:hypothetical protein